MGAIPVPAGLSLYRGQADQGIGEPGAGIRRGEQYIAADPALADDAGLLRAVRDWLTLDSTPADHGRANGRLTGWATFPLGPYTFVVRLGNAGKYGGRDAYFTHARVWQTVALPADTDPGLYIGIDQCFVERTEAIASRVQDELPTPSPAPMEPILARKDLAISLTAHLFHAMLSGVSLIVAVPITDFGATSPLPRLIAFARGALPARLRRRCRIRIFSRSPQRLLDPSNGPGGADLILIPNDQTVRDALTAAGGAALLLDEYGERRQGSAPAEGLLAYAGNLLDSAQRFPDRLTAFTNRFDTLWPDDRKPPTAAQTDWIDLTYNLTVALAGSEMQRGSLFANYLLAQARANPKVPWSTLIRPEDWARFPQEHLIRFILRADDDLSPGERQLQGLLATVFQQRGETLDSGLSAWWSPTDPAKRRRLLELCQPDPPLLSPAASAALTVSLSVEELAAGGTPITGALRAEQRQGQLGRRQRDADRLLALLEQPGLFELLDQAARDGVLPAPWQGGDLGAMSGPQAIALARQLLRASDEQSVAAATGLIPRMLDRLRQEPTGLEAIADDLRNALYRIDVPRNPERYLDLADAMRQARPGSADELRARLWDATKGLAMVDDPKGLLAGIIEGRWSVVRAGDLLGENDGSLNVEPTARTAGALLGSPAVAERIGRKDLMALGDLLPADGHRAVAAYHARIDALMRSEPQATTDRLIQYGAWLAWRRHAGQRLGTEERHRYAMDWLTSPILVAYRTASAANLPPQWVASTETDQRRPAIDLTMETWDQVVEDLGPLGYADIDQLTANETHWPWIYPFELPQVLAVAAKCDDLDALALLAQRVSSQLEIPQARIVAWLWKRVPHRKAWSGDPLGWLLGDPQARPLDLETAGRLVNASRAYRQNARKALVGAIVAALETEPKRAIEAIEIYGGWSHPQLLTALRHLLLRALPAVDLLKRIEQGLTKTARTGPPATSSPAVADRKTEELAHRLYREGYQAIAALLSPGLAAWAAEERWLQQVIDALAEPTKGDSALSMLRQRVHDALRAPDRDREDNPLLALRDRIERLPASRRGQLHENGWAQLRGLIEQDAGFCQSIELANGEPVLPIFYLGLSLQPGGSGQAGQLAQQLMSLPASSELRRDEHWWRALLASVLDQTDPGYVKRDRSAGARLHWAEQTRNGALGLIDSTSADLPADQCAALNVAWQRLNIAGFWTQYGAIDQ